MVYIMYLSRNQDSHSESEHLNGPVTENRKQIKKYVWVNGLCTFLFVYAIISMFAIAYLFNNICILRNCVEDLKNRVHVFEDIMEYKLQHLQPFDHEKSTPNPIDPEDPVALESLSSADVEERNIKSDFVYDSMDSYTNSKDPVMDRKRRNIAYGEESAFSSTARPRLMLGGRLNNMYRMNDLNYPGSEEEDAGTYMSRRDEQSLRDAMRMYRTRRPLNIEEESKSRHFRIPAVHYDGDTSGYDMNLHAHYQGNGHLRHLSKNYVDWKPAQWIDDYEANKYFIYDNGVVTIKKSGLYFIYAQIYYLDVHDTNAFRVYRNEQILLQCTVTSHSAEEEYKGNTCYTSSVTHLVEEDQIRVKDLFDGRYSIFEEGKSFFGLVKLDSRILG